MMVLIALWALTYGAELSSQQLPQMLFWIRLEYVGISFLPSAWIVFVIRFVGNERWLNLRNSILIFLVPAVTLVMVWTNPYHHLHYAGLAVDDSGPFPLLAIRPGPWYGINTVYFYAMLAWGLMLLVVKFKNADAVYKKQNRTIIVAAIIPWIVNLVYLFDFRPFGHIDLTPYAFIATSLMISIGLLKFRLFDVVFIARDKVIDALNEGVLVLDAQNRVIDLNPEMRKILSGNKVIGMKLAELFTEGEVEELLSDRQNKTIEISLLTSAGSRVYEVNTTSLAKKDTAYSGTILLFMDVTERNTAELKMRIQTEELAELNKLKDKLFSIVAHDLRSPLITLMDILNMAKAEELSELEFKSFLPSLSSHTEYTYGLLENLLHWSKSQLTGETVHPELFDLALLTRNNINFYTEKARQKGISLQAEVEEGALVFADKSMIQLVIRNLFNNAIKFCRENGRIRISAVGDDQYTTVCVSDTGVGIPAADMNRLFRLENFTTRGTNNEQGTGLGLMLCKEFVEKNSGTIWAESTAGEGSRFYFRLPSKLIDG